MNVRFRFLTYQENQWSCDSCLGLTKQKKQRRNLNRIEEDEKGEEEKVGWRGPREEPSEIPMKRKIFCKNNLVLTQFVLQFNICLQY